MGIYSTDYNTSNVAMNEAYATPYGAMQMALDAKCNDLAMFESLIVRDIQEATAINAGDSVMMEEVQVITEASISGLWASVVALVKKIAAKIKAIFEKVITKLGMLFTRDNAQLIKKYEKLVLGKDLTKMKVSGYMNIKVADPSDDSIIDLDVFKNINAGKFNSISTIEGINKAIFTIDNFYGRALGKTELTVSEFRDELKDKIFDTKETVDGISSEEIHKAINILSGKNTVKNMKKKESDIQKSLSELEKAATKNHDAVAKDHDDTEQDIKLARIRAHMSDISNAQTACSTAFSAWIGNVKTAISQSRRIFTMAATYTLKIESAYVEALGYVDESEVEEYFEDFED